MGGSQVDSERANGVGEIQPFELADRLEVGIRMTLVTESGCAKETSYGVDVRGWDEMSYIITSVPERKPGMAPLRGGLTVTARVLAGGTAYGFRTRIMDIQARPANVMFLQYPGSVAAKDVRAHKRISVFLLVSITTETDDHVETGKGIIRDLAAGGCCIETDMDLPVEEEVAVSFILPDGKNVQNVASLVRNQRDSMDGYAYGMQFLADQSTKEIRTIRDFFASIGELDEDM